MEYLKIGTTNISGLIAAMTVSYNVLLSEDSGRNARGDNTVDIVNRKVKITCTTRPLDQTEMGSLLTAVEPYVVNVSYLDSQSGTLKTVQAYISTPEPAYYRIIDGKVLYNPLQLSFIEM